MSETHFRLRGDIDMLNADELAQELAETVRGSDGGLVIDCSDLTFIDSSGLKALLVTQRALAEEGRTFQLTNPSRTMRVLCNAAGVTHVFRIRDSAADTVSR